MNKPTPPNDGGPAFPKAGSWVVEGYDGMSLRDYFIAAALQGMCTRLTTFNIAEIADGIAGAKRLSTAACVIADEVIRQRNKPQTTS